MNLPVGNHNEQLKVLAVIGPKGRSSGGKGGSGILKSGKLICREGTEDEASLQFRRANRLI